MSIQIQKTPYNQSVTILNDNKYTLTGDPIEGNKPGRTPRLGFNMRGSYPEIVIRLNNGKTGEEGRISLPIDLIAFNQFIVMLEDAIKSTSPIANIMHVKKAGFDAAARKPIEPYVYAAIVVGRDTDNCVFVSVVRGKPGSKNHLKLKFHFIEPEFHPLVDASTGERLPRDKVSTMVARAYKKTLEQLLPMVNAHLWDYTRTIEGKMAAKNAGNGNNGNNGGYNNQQSNSGYSTNNSGGSYNAPAEPQQASFDDIPW